MTNLSTSRIMSFNLNSDPDIIYMKKMKLYFDFCLRLTSQIGCSLTCNLKKIKNKLFKDIKCMSDGVIIIKLSSIALRVVFGLKSLIDLMTQTFDYFGLHGRLKMYFLSKKIVVKQFSIVHLARQKINQS